MNYLLARRSRSIFIAVLFAYASSSALVVNTFSQQKMDSIAKQQVMSMLKNVKNAIKNNYYDPTFKGIDIEARFKAAEEKLKTTETLGQAFSVIAQAVIDLNDSHTRFYPPSRNAIVEYGWRMKMFGDKAFITGIQENSNASAKGLKVGDEVLSVNGFRPSRNELWKMIYYYQVLNPQTKVALEVRSPDQGDSRRLEILSKITETKRVMNLNDSIDFNEAAREGSKLASLDKHYFREAGNTLIWKMPDFAFDPGEVDGMIGKAQGKRTLILDLRGNPGGFVVTLEKLAGYFFDKDTKIAEVKGRKPMDPQLAKSQGSKMFPGNLIVLVDSNSGSAAEIFARLIQIEKRGTVLGDVSAGAVMMSRGESFDAGADTVISYGMNLTRADVIMTDGKSLEHIGVQPDEVLIPTGADLANFRDPVLARALEISGVSMDPAAAGKLLPQEKFVSRKSNIAIRLDF